MFEFLLTAFETISIVITNNISQYRLLHTALERNQMIKTFITFGMFGSFPTRQHNSILIGYANRIYHFMFGISRVNVTAFESHSSHSRIKVFILQFAYFTTIHRIGPICSKGFNIKLVRSFAYLLVRIECNAYLAMFNLRVFQKILHRCHNFGNTCFIVGPQQSLPIRNNKVLTYIMM